MCSYRGINVLQFLNFMKMRFNFRCSWSLYLSTILRANWLGNLLKAPVIGATARNSADFVCQCDDSLNMLLVSSVRWFFVDCKLSSMLLLVFCKLLDFDLKNSEKLGSQDCKASEDIGIG